MGSESGRGQPTHAYVALHLLKLTIDNSAFVLENYLFLDSVLTFLPMSLFTTSGLPCQNDSNHTGPRNSLGALRHSRHSSWTLADGERQFHLSETVDDLVDEYSDTMDPGQTGKKVFIVAEARRKYGVGSGPPLQDSTVSFADNNPELHIATLLGAETPCKDSRLYLALSLRSNRVATPFWPTGVSIFPFRRTQISRSNVPRCRFNDSDLKASQSSA
ncbi:hypothetical protein V8E53_002945 [Lactarius tabidus]